MWFEHIQCVIREYAAFHLLDVYFQCLSHFSQMIIMVHYQIVSIFSVLIKLQRWEKSQQPMYIIISSWKRCNNRVSTISYGKCWYSDVTETISWGVLTWCETWGSLLKISLTRTLGCWVFCFLLSSLTQQFSSCKRLKVLTVGTKSKKAFCSVCDMLPALDCRIWEYCLSHLDKV